MRRGVIIVLITLSLSGAARAEAASAATIRETLAQASREARSGSELSGRFSFRDNLLWEIARAQLEMGDGEGASATAGEIENPRLALPVLIEVAVARVENREGALTDIARRIEEAEDATLADMELLLLAGRARAGDLEQAIEAAESYEDPLVAANAQGAIAVALAEAGRVGEAAVAAERISADHEEIRCTALTEIAWAEVRAGDIDRAEVRRKQAVDRCGYVAPERSRDLVDGLLEESKTEQARWVAESMVQPSCDADDPGWVRRAELLAVIARAQIADDDLAGALESAGSIVGSSGEPSRKQVASEMDGVLRDLVEAHVEAGDVESASPLIENMDCDYCKAMGRLEIAHAREEPSREASLSRVREQGEGLEDAGDRVRVFARYAEHVHPFDPVGAVESFERSVEIAQSMGDSKWKASLLRQVSAAQARAGEASAARETFARALSVIRGLSFTHSRSREVRRLVEAQAEGRSAAAAIPFDTALELAGVKPEEAPSAVAALAAAQAAAGDVGGAVERAKTIAPDDPFHARALTEVAMQAGPQVSISRVLEIVNAIPHRSDRAEALRLLARLEASQGSADKPPDWVKSESDSLVRARTLLGVAQGMMDRIE